MKLKTVDNLIRSKQEEQPSWYNDLLLVSNLLKKNKLKMTIPQLVKATGLGYGHLTTILNYPIAEYKFCIKHLGGNYTKLGRCKYWFSDVNEKT